MKDDKTCVVCGKAYKYCQSCPSKYNTSETWRNIFCSENCRSIYHIYDQLKAGQISEKNANKELKKLDMSYLDMINESMKALITLTIHGTENKNINSDISKIDNDSKEAPQKTLPKHRVKKK